MAFDLTSLIGNAASGGILGAVGSIASGFISVLQQKGQFTHDENMAALTLKQIAANADAARGMSADQLRLAQEQGANQAFVASQAASNIANVPPFVAGLLSLWRPALTAGLIGYSLYMFPSVSAETQQNMVNAYTAAGTASIMWWFGSRQIEKGSPTKPAAVAKTGGGSAAATAAPAPAPAPAAVAAPADDTPAPTPHGH